MANRYERQFMSSLDGNVKTVYARVSFGASGTPTLVTSNFRSKGIYSVTRSSQGVFVFTFGSQGQTKMLDIYNRTLFFSYCPFFSGGAAAPIYCISADAVATLGTSTITILLANGNGSATDPASGEVGLFQFVFSDCSAP